MSEETGSIVEMQDALRRKNISMARFYAGPIAIKHDRHSRPITKLGASTLISKTTADALQEQTAILLNEACELPVSGSTSERLLAAFL